MNRAYYSDRIAGFLDTTPNAIVGELVRRAGMEGAHIESTQTDAWLEEIAILRTELVHCHASNLG
jgi:hypothetical protein